MGSDIGNILMLNVLVSAFGMAYFIYGKKESDFSFMIFGAALGIYPYFVGGVWPLLLVGLVLAIAPFAIRRWY